MRKPRAYSEVYGDRWNRVVDVFKVLRDPAMAEELRRRLSLTPFARAEFEAADEDAHEAEGDLVERVRLTIIRSFMGHDPRARAPIARPALDRTATGATLPLRMIGPTGRR